MEGEAEIERWAEEEDGQPRDGFMGPAASVSNIFIIGSGRTGHFGPHRSLELQIGVYDAPTFRIIPKSLFFAMLIHGKLPL